jgi:hypothetical protein
MNKLSPIVLFVYNRPEHTKKTVQALKKNELVNESQLYVFSDGPKNEENVNKVNEVRNIIKKIDSFDGVEIVERNRNLGLANSVITGVTEVINKHGKVIVLEDDIVTSPAFLVYMNKLLDVYKDKKRVYSVTGYNFPLNIMKIPDNYPYDIYFHPRAASWSWGTWKDRWDKADWEVKDFKNFKKDKDLQEEFNRGGGDMARMLIQQMEGKIDSWAIRWCYTLFKNNAYCVYPVKSYINNIGLDNTGVHCGKSAKYYNKNLKNSAKDIFYPGKITPDSVIVSNFKKIFNSNFKNKMKYLLNFFNTI